MAKRSGLYYAQVGGRVSAERLLARGVCYCCKTAVAAGPDNRIAAAWRHVYPGNLRDIAAAPPADWSLVRRQEYFDWARRVVDELPAASIELRRAFDEAYRARLK